MNISLIHTSFEPIMYGIALFLSFLSLAYKVKKQNYVGFIVEIIVIATILMIHGGSVTGGFAATIAGLLSGTALPMLFPKRSFSEPLHTIKVQPAVAKPPVVIDYAALLQPQRRSNLAQHIFDNYPR